MLAVAGESILNLQPTFFREQLARNEDHRPSPINRINARQKTAACNDQQRFLFAAYRDHRQPRQGNASKANVAGAWQENNAMAVIYASCAKVEEPFAKSGLLLRHRARQTGCYHAGTRAPDARKPKRSFWP